MHTLAMVTKQAEIDADERLTRMHSDNRSPQYKDVGRVLAKAIQDSAGDYVSDTVLLAALWPNGPMRFYVTYPREPRGGPVEFKSPMMVSTQHGYRLDVGPSARDVVIDRRA
jgi:hypothetical protein